MTVPSAGVTRRVLVTGASGFIGSHCLPPLRERGYEVHAVRSPAPSGNATAPAVGPEWHEADLLDPASASALLDAVRPTHLLHLAWFVVPGEVISSPVNYAWLERSVGLLRAFVEGGGSRAVLCGSAYEYDWRYGYCSEELTPLAPTTVYGACKQALFTIATSIVREAGVSLAWPRPFFMYGPREHPNRLVAAVARAMLTGEPARTSHGRQIRDYLHVQDVADAIVAVLDGDLTGPVNIGSGVPVTLREIVVRLGSITGRPELLELDAIPARANDAALVVADPKRLAEEVGWRPRFDLQAGLEHTVDWWRAELGHDGVRA